MWSRQAVMVKLIGFTQQAVMQASATSPVADHRRANIAQIYLNIAIGTVSSWLQMPVNWLIAVRSMCH
jgi:hypothetical protein